MKTRAKNAWLCTAVLLLLVLFITVVLLSFWEETEQAFRWELAFPRTAYFAVGCAGVLGSSVLFMVVLSLCRRRRRLEQLKKVLYDFAEGNYRGRADERGRGTVSGLSAAANRLADKLQAADSMREDFMRNVSHDIKTPMTVILGYVSNLLNGAISREEEPRYLELVRREITRLSGLIGIYQEVSRIDTGDWEFILQPTDFCAILQQTVGIFVDKLEEKNLEGNLECPEEPLWVMADGEAIGRVLYCLVDNAVKFTPEGGRMEISLCRRENRADFAIYNEGPGIAADTLPYIFERSYKGDDSRGLEKDSFGFGLYLCKRILEKHGTEIRAESEYGKYCRFRFSLPVCEADSVSAKRKNERI